MHKILSQRLHYYSRTVLLNLPIFYIFHLLLCFTGLIIYAYYAKIGCDPLANGDIRSSNQVFRYVNKSLMALEMCVLLLGHCITKFIVIFFWLLCSELKYVILYQTH